MRAELFLQDAPNTVANFVELANSGFYDGLEIFRVVTGVLIQTGDPNNDGTGGPGYSIRGEFSENGYENPVSHSRGTLSMARLVNDKDSAGSQFFYPPGVVSGIRRPIRGLWPPDGRGKPAGARFVWRARPWIQTIVLWCNI